MQQAGTSKHSPLWQDPVPWQHYAGAGALLCSGGLRALGMDSTFLRSPYHRLVLIPQAGVAVAYGAECHGARRGPGYVGGELRKDECTGGPGHLTLVLVRGQARGVWAVRHGRPVGGPVPKQELGSIQCPVSCATAALTGDVFPTSRFPYKAVAFLAAAPSALLKEPESMSLHNYICPSLGCTLPAQQKYGRDAHSSSCPGKRHRS